MSRRDFLQVSRLGGLSLPDLLANQFLAAEPAIRSYTTMYLMNSIMHTLFDIGQLRVTDNVPKPVIDIIAGWFTNTGTGLISLQFIQTAK